MFLPHEISKIKDQRRLKQRGIDEDEANFILHDSPLDYAFNPQNDGQETAEANDDSGVTIGPFNMKQEVEEGTFDTEGNYVEGNRKMTSTNRSLNRDEGDDPWIASLEEQAFLASKKDNDDFYSKKPLRVSQDKPDLFQALENTATVDVIKRLVSLLQSGETPVDAIKYNQKKPSKKRCLPGMRKAEGDAAPKGNSEKAEAQSSTPATLADMGVSDLAHFLTITWQNVYYMTKEEIIEALVAAKTNPKGNSTSAPARYEFKWINGDDKVYGPSTDVEILRWIAYDYISDKNPVLLRKLNSDGQPVADEWIGFRDTKLYTFLNERLSGPSTSTGVKHHVIADGDSGSNDESEEDDTFAKKHRKDELIGIKRKGNKDAEDSPASDDDPDIE